MSQTEYLISPADADMLRGAALLPLVVRELVLKKQLADHGPAALAVLFAHFIGAANAVSENCREVSGLQLMIEGGSQDPYITDKINMPTIAGAMQGVILAATVDPKGVCAGCAYRLGSVANQCYPTTCDADYCVEEGKGFMCHEDLLPDGEPRRVCVGHAKRAKELKS